MVAREGVHSSAAEMLPAARRVTFNELQRRGLGAAPEVELAGARAVARELEDVRLQTDTPRHHTRRWRRNTHSACR